MIGWRSKSDFGDALSKFLSPVFRFYFRSFPVATGKLWVWTRIVQPYIAWRPLRLEAITASGLRLWGPLSDYIHNSIYFFGVWEPALTRYITDHLVPGDVFIDIGANVGVHTMLAAQRVGVTGRVHAIEASSTIFAVLRENLAHNALTNVVTYNVAASDRAGKITVYLHDANNLGRTTIMPHIAGASTAFSRSEEIEARPCSDIVPMEDLLRAKMIKIDVEGAEWLVLLGLAAVLPRLRDDVSIVVEVSHDALVEHGVSIAQLLELFSSRGYSGARVADHSAEMCIDGVSGELLSIPEHFNVMDLVFRRVVHQPALLQRSYPIEQPALAK